MMNSGHIVAGAIILVLGGGLAFLMFSYINPPPNRFNDYQTKFSINDSILNKKTEESHLNSDDPSYRFSKDGTIVPVTGSYDDAQAEAYGYAF